MNPLVKRFLQLAVIQVFQVVVLSLSAGSWQWADAWLYLASNLVLLSAGSMILLPRHREVIMARTGARKDSLQWDMVVTRIMTIPAIGTLVIAGLDERLRPTHTLGRTVQGVGLLIFIIAYGIILSAMYFNRFFEQTVRIQTDRHHRVIEDGPYRFARHPGYVGMILSFFGGVLILDSTWALIPAGLYAGLLILRTFLEDRTLTAELKGYREYTHRTRYRLLPGIW